MKVKWTRYCVALLVLFIPLHFASCSSSQQQDDWEMGEFNNEWNDEYNEWNDENGEWNDEYNEWNDENGEWNDENGEWNDNYDNWNNLDDFDNADTGFDGSFDDFLGDDEFAFDNTNNDLSSILSEMDQVDPGMNEIIDAAPSYENAYMDPGFDDLTEVDQGIDTGLDGGYAEMPMDPAPMASGSPALPEYGSKMPYIVERGDTLGKIATKIYGNSARWREMADLSALTNPSRIYPGDVVYYQLTEETMNFATIYESLPREEVIVNLGDTLSTIAGRVFGDPSNWKAIWRQNDNVSNPDRLEVGMVLHYLVPGSLVAALDMNQNTAVAAVQDVPVDSLNMTEVQLEITPEQGMIDMVVVETKTLNAELMA